MGEEIFVRTRGSLDDQFFKSCVRGVMSCAARRLTEEKVLSNVELAEVSMMMLNKISIGSPK
jgi:hypothetical protein